MSHPQEKVNGTDDRLSFKTGSAHDTMRHSEHGNEVERKADIGESQTAAEPQHRGFRFWMVMLGLMLAALMSGLDSSISTALPTIAHDFALGPNFVWVLDVYFLATAVVQPPLAQLADLWGRRWVFISTVAIFVLGSGLIAGASSGGMLIAARAVQGIGAGGINMMIDLIICDLVPLRERGNYIGLVFGLAITIAGLGPLIGGALTNAGAWRWIFWLNLPIGGLCIAIMLAFLRVSSHRNRNETKLASTAQGRWRDQGPWKIFVRDIQGVDWVGTALIAASTTSSLWALAYGGSARPWSDGAIIAALICGIVGLLLFLFWEGSRWCSNPLAPLKLFANRTSAAAFLLSFTNTILIYWVNYMIPIYFQAVLGASPQQSGIWLLPFSLTFPFGAALSGFLLAKTGRYKPIHLAGFALCSVACGAFSMLKSSSAEAAWVVLQMVLSVGVAAPSATTLSAVQAPLEESDAAKSTGTWAFMRSLGSIWSVAIPAAVFNSRFDQLLNNVDDQSARATLADGQAYAHASSALVDGFTGQVRDQVIEAYTHSLQRTWQVGIVFSGVSFLVVLLEREVTMRQELNTEFGLEENQAKVKSKV